jgi:hypothetical protein|tara:strand:- start:523 stop:708 length:186 start_codon:yes stop_codon:yes gene_type:complete
MLGFTERVLAEVRKLRRNSEDLVINGSIRDMEQYRFLMGRIEGYKFVEVAIAELLKKNPED